LVGWSGKDETGLVGTFKLLASLKNYKIADSESVDIIIIGSSYEGLSAGLALGRSLRNVLVIDSGEPCNKQTPHANNFLTQAGKTDKRFDCVHEWIVSIYRQTIEKNRGE
jgi:hypothetical protein